MSNRPQAVKHDIRIKRRVKPLSPGTRERKQGRSKPNALVVWSRDQ